MQSAIDNIKATYDYDQCKEIVDHGCQSGVCSEHIYTRDTIKFFETYEDEILEYIADSLDDEASVEIWHNNTCNYYGYMNDSVWTFIECVAMEVVDEVEEQQRKDDLVIEGYNPARSMSMSRYAHV